MGGGSWSTSTYAASTGVKITRGTTFAYSGTTARSPRSTWTAHESLDPKKVASAGSPLAGKIVREARDSADHPTSVPIAVFFDETGSMGHVPVQLQKKLAELFALLLRKGYVEHPQVLMGGYGDGDCDSVPLQVGQFESDNRADETLDNLFLEGNGGGNGGESAALAWWYMANHTATDAWEKRGKKGYLFTIGDETSIPVTREQIASFITPDHGLEKDPTLAAVVAQAQERWELFHLVINNTTARGQRSVEFYTKLLGNNAIVLEDPEAACETIALAIGLAEGTIDLDEGLDDLKELGVDARSAEAAGKALARYGSVSGGGSIVVSDAPDDLDGDPTDRL